MRRMRFTPAVRISVGLVLFTMTLLMGADMAGLLPDPLTEVLEMRKKVCESLAIYGSLAVQNGDAESIPTTIQLVVSRNDDILSAALRTGNGTVLAQAGDHRRHWRGGENDRSTPTDVLVPIFKEDRRWGTFEVCFQPIYAKGIFGLWAKPIIKLIVLVLPFAFLGYLLFI